MRKNPKDSITELRIAKRYTGNHQRFLLQKDSFDKNFYLPSHVEYEDIDDAFIEFVDEKVHMEAHGKKVPTYTLFSNHRFTEFSQTYGHTDEDGNLLMDFKTVGRETNPKAGSGQNNLFNIPGNRRYTVGIRTVLDDNGTEHYEVSSMEQPISLDFEYTVNYVTADFGKLNEFNMKLNSLFQSQQYYISPNGYEMPVYLNEISDETEYSIDNRKVFIQTASFTVKGYVIPKDTLRIEKFPKRVNVGVSLEIGKSKPMVEVDGEGDDEIIVLSFPTNAKFVSFEFDDEFSVGVFESENIRSFRISVNGDLVKKPSEGLVLHDEDDVAVHIVPVDFRFPSKLKVFKSQTTVHKP